MVLPQHPAAELVIGLEIVVGGGGQIAGMGIEFFSDAPHGLG